MIYTPYIWPQFIAAAIMLGLVLYGRRFKGLPQTKYFQWLMLMAAAWAILFGIYLSGETIEEKVLLLKIWEPFSLGVAVLLFAFAASHCGKDHQLTGRNLALISIVPILIMIAVLTLDFHSLYFYNMRLVGSGVPYVLQTDPGPIYIIEAFYCYGLIIAATALLIRSMVGANSLYVKQGMILLLGMLVPAMIEVLAYLGITGLDFAPGFFVLTGVLYTWGLHSYRILDIRPVAREEVVENMTDILLIADNADRLIDFNRAASRTMLRKAGNPTGSPISKAVPFSADFIMRYKEEKSFRSEVTMMEGEEKKIFDASVMPVIIKNKVRGRMILLRDIAERKRMEDALHTANIKLSLLSSITRHDLLNSLTAIEGYTKLARMEPDINKARNYLSKLDRVFKGTHDLIMFTKDYEYLGAQAPGWHDVGYLFGKATDQLNLGNIQVISSINGLKVHGDTLLEKVFYNLLDNSLRHGKNVSVISFSFREQDGGIAMIYEDNGIGIPAPDKTKIFERNFGTNSGLGLFLSREILAITGIEIEECGVPGKGARFEMVVPEGAYRLT